MFNHFKFSSKNNFFYDKGFSLVEMLIVISIITIILSISTHNWRANSLRKEVHSATENIVAKLELAKTNAVTGKYGQNYGVKFENNSFIYFPGSSYIESNENNQVSKINNRLQLETNIPGASESVVFSRITGNINHSQTLSIVIFEIQNPENKREVQIGVLGDISVIQ